MSDVPSLPQAFPSSSRIGSSANFMPFSAGQPVTTPPFPSQANPGSASNTARANNSNNPSSKRRKRPPLSRRAKILLLVLVIALFIPSLILIAEGINGYTLYNQSRSGLAHLQNAQNIFKSGNGTTNDTAKYFNSTKLQQAQQEIDAAHNDFQQLSVSLDQDGAIGLLGNLQVAQITSARSLGHIGVDATEVAQRLIQTAIKLGPSLAPLLSHPVTDDKTDTVGPLKPYLTPAQFDEVYTDLDFIKPRVHDMQLNAQSVSLTSLPLSDKQRTLLATTLKLLPVADTALSQISSMKKEVSWLLGIDTARSFLVETMDRGEIRATGGFTGQFSELILNGAHVSPLKFKNLGQFEEDHSDTGVPVDPVYAKVAGQKAPAPYTWWPYANFGLRDANLSADFPNSAKIMMNTYNHEFDKQLDGVIIFTPFLITHILHITGPIAIPDYNETVTEQNLEPLLHYYQLDNAGVRKEEIVEHIENPEIARKLFTQKVSKTLLAEAQKLPADKLIALINEISVSMKTRDLQIYMSNPQVEALVAKYGFTASLDRSTTHDGLTIIQSNLSASKASQYVTTTIDDTITLDAAGTAKHSMQLTLDYQQKGDVYGLDTYRDYMRIYVPSNSQFISGNGFVQRAEPYCGASAPAAGYRVCPQDVYKDGSLVCAANPDPGYAAWLTDDPYYAQKHPLDSTGAPQNQISDEPGRNMYGGWVVIPKNCIMKVTLSWSVPAANQSYNLLFQRQASIFPQINLTIKPSTGMCSTSKPTDLRFSGTIQQDTTFALQTSGSACSLHTQS